MTLSAMAVIGATIAVSSFLSGVFGMAGGMVLLGVLLVYFDVPTSMLVFSIIQMASNGWRTMLWWRFIRWRIFGVYVLDGVILISQIKQLRQEGAPLREAVERGAELRMRPVLMTALAAAIGLLPASVATGIGRDPARAADDLSADASVAGTAPP